MVASAGSPERQYSVQRRTVRDILRFTSVAAGPAMLVVLGLRLAGFLGHVEATADLVVLFVIGVGSTAALAWLGRTR